MIYSHVLESCLLPMVGAFTRSQFWGAYRRMSRQGTMAWPSVHATPDDALEALLRHAGANVPIHRRRFEDVGVDPESATFSDLNRLPAFTKADIAANFPEGVTSTQSNFQPWRYVSTSGTLSRLTAIHDFRKRDASRAASLLSLSASAGYRPGMKYMEIPPNVCRDNCGLSDSVEPSLFSYLLESLKWRRITAPSTVSDIRGLVESQVIFRRMVLPSVWQTALVQPPEVLNRCLKQIHEYRPAVVKAQAVYLYLLAVHILDNGLRPPEIGKCVMPMGSLLSPVMKRTVECAFDRPVFQDYGCAELGGIAAECNHGDGHHPFHSLFRVEVVKNGRPTRVGELGKILLTDYYSYAMPFIRYEIGDVARILPGDCRCGSASPRFQVEGRIEDCLMDSGGGLVTASELIDMALAQPGVLLFQIEANPDGPIRLQVVPRAGVTPCLKSLSAALSHRLGSRARIVAQLVSNLRPENSGKFRWVKNRDARIVKALG